MTLVLSGRVVPLDDDDPSAAFTGRVFVGDDGTIEAVTKGNGATPAGFASAATVDVGNNIVMPGLIDLHNHLGYNTLPLWSEPSQVEPAALLAYVQARALAGGTTAIQGWPAANRKVGQALRNVDDEAAGSNDENLIYTAVVTTNPLQLSQMAQKVNKGTGFIYHCAEGKRDSVVRDEFIDAANVGCLQPTFVGIHCNAISHADWQLWGAHDAVGRRTPADPTARPSYGVLRCQGSAGDRAERAKQGANASATASRSSCRSGRSRRPPPPSAPRSSRRSRS